MTPSSKALWCTIAFALAGISSWVLLVKDFFVSLPLGIFYVILLINTYHSIKLFASVSPKDHVVNNALDISLVGIFLLMTLSFANPLVFVFFGLLLFIVATAKYASLLDIIDHGHLMRNKILVDVSGTMLCALTLGGIIFGYTAISTWLCAILFAIANILLFFVWPLYRLDR